jgi:CheY-like chemotaxis protein
MREASSQLRVLVVEDAEFQRMMLEQALRSLGVREIRSASNGAEAMRVLRAFPAVDIVVMDVVMPDVDGIELIPMLRDVAMGASLVFVSSEQWTLDVSTEIAKGHGLSVLGTIDKPVSPQKLRPLLDAHLERRARSENQP